MAASDSNSGVRPGAGYEFTTTHWSVVSEAGRESSTNASPAMAQLCQMYWYPLYAYVRRKGYGAADAQDLTQGFFAKLLARNYLSVADRNKGKFRSFLLGSLEHFLAREWTKAHAQKRGGTQAIVSLDEVNAEGRYLLEPADQLTAERIFDRRWATTLLDHSMLRLREECKAEQKADLLEKTEGHLSGEKSEASYAEVATALAMSEGAVKVAVHRLRRRYGELVREEIARTVSTQEEVDEELQYLAAVLRE